jgi:hypothetical protein
MKSFFFIVFLVLILTSCGGDNKVKDIYNNVLVDEINKTNSLIVSAGLRDTVSLVTIDSIIKIKDVPYFDDLPKFTNRDNCIKDINNLGIKGHHDITFIVSTIKVYESGYYVKKMMITEYNETEKESFSVYQQDNLSLKVNDSLLNKWVTDYKKSDNEQLLNCKNYLKSYRITDEGIFISDEKLKKI